MRPRVRIILTAALLLITTAGVGGAAWGDPIPQGDAAAPSPAHSKPLIAGVCDRPPYSFQQPDGSWDGMAVQLWRIAASKARIEYQWKVLPSDALDDALANGDIDIAVTGIPIIAGARRFNYSQPFEAAGVVIVTRSAEQHGVLDALRRIATREMLFWLLIILGAMLIAAVVVAHLERRRNPQFPQGPTGLLEGLWWSVTTMSTVGYGDRVPITRRGRMAAAIWMLISFGLMTILSGVIAASITVGRLTPLVQGPEDLARHRIGTGGGQGTQQLLSEVGAVRALTYDSPVQGLHALQGGAIDAFLGEATVMRYLIQQDRFDSLVLLPHRLLRIFVGLGLSPKLPTLVRAAIDESVVETVESKAWSEYLQRLLGGADE